LVKYFWSAIINDIKNNKKFFYQISGALIK